MLKVIMSRPRQPAKPPHAVPCIKWEGAPKFELKKEWRVAAGEESECVGGLMAREMLNSFRSVASPRPCSSNVEDDYYDDSNIPEIPVIPIEEAVAEEEDEDYDDSHLPEIPIIPIEEAEEAQLNATAPVDSCPVPPPQPVLNNQSASTTCQCNPPVSQMQRSCENSLADLLKGLKDSDIVSAVTVATTAASILQNKEQGSSVDTNLLIEILQEPQTMMKLADTNKFGIEVKTQPEPGEPSSQEILAISNPVTEEEFIPISHRKDIAQSETAHARGKAPVQIMPIYSPKLMNQLSPFKRSKSGMSLATNLIVPGSSYSSRINIEKMKPVSSLTPPTLETNLEMVKGGLIPKYGSGFQPVSPLIHSTSKQDEEIEKIVNKYIGHYNAAKSESYMMDPHFQSEALAGVVAERYPFPSTPPSGSHMMDSHFQSEVLTSAAERFPFPCTPPSGYHMMDPYLQSAALVGLVERYTFPLVTNGHPAPPSGSHMMDPHLHYNALIGVGERYHFPSVTNSHSTPPLKNIEYRKFLVRQHGEARAIKENELLTAVQGPEFARITEFEPHLNCQMPNMYETGSYQHFTSQPRRMMRGPLHNQGPQGRVVDAPVEKRLKLW